jgi:hypothetical protein
MLAAIQFCDDVAPRAGEVDDVWADRMLSAKFETQQATIAQRRPHPPFGVCRVLAQLTGSPIGHRPMLPASGK